jgi:glycosyltransferase involved in cell wall biosynthesis
MTSSTTSPMTRMTSMTQDETQPRDAAKGDAQGRRYVLVSAAYNEEAFIEKTIQSVIKQTEPPLKWVIVSDGSTDGTDGIVRKYAAQYPFVELLRLEKDHKRNFAAQVHAINAGCEKLKTLEFDFLGNLDSDVVIPSADYFARLLSKFEQFPNLGLGGGYIYEEERGEFKGRPANTTRSVAHAVQLFRRGVFDEMGGGYVPLRYGGPDWCAEINVRMRGWQVESFPDLPVHHLRPTGGGTGRLRYWYQQGFMDYSLGSHPAFEIVKCLKRLPAKPYVIGAMARLTAFFLAYLRGEERPVSKEFVTFLRNDQMGRLRQSASASSAQRTNAPQPRQN